MQSTVQQGPLRFPLAGHHDVATDSPYTGEARSSVRSFQTCAISAGFASQ